MSNSDPATPLAVVTGASRGIGRAIAARLSENGFKVVAIARSRDDLENTVGAMGGAGGHAIVADLRSIDQIRRACDEVLTLGTPNVIVNAAGVWHDEKRKFQGPLLAETEISEIDDVISVGLRGTFFICRQLLPGMVSRKGGRIVQIGCGFAGSHEAVGWLHYYVTNRAISAFTEGLAAELRPAGIQVNCVAPWFVASDAVRRFYPDQVGTALEVAEVVDAVIELLAPWSANITGQTIELRSNRDF